MTYGCFSSREDEERQADFRCKEASSLLLRNYGQF